MGRVRPRLRHRALAHQVSRPRRRSGRRALPRRADPGLLPRAREGDAPGRGERPGQVGGGPRLPPRGHRGRGRHSRPREVQGRDRGARRSPQDHAGAGRGHPRDGAADLLLQRGAPFDRDRQPRDGHGAGVPTGGVGAADDPADPQERHRPHQPGVRAGRARQGGRLVLPLPQGKDRLRDSPGEVAAVLGLLRLPRQQPRHAPAGPQADAGGAPDVHRVSPDRGPRPARVDPPAPHLERHGALQREPRPDRPRGVDGDLVPRGPGPDRARDAGRLDVGLRRAVGAPLPRLRREQPQLAGPRLRDLRQRHRRDRRAQAAQPALRRQAGHGARVVPRLASRQDVRVVPAGQHQLHGVGLPVDPGLHGQEREGHAPQLLPEGLQLLAEGREGEAVRVRDPGGSGRPAARRAARRGPAQPADRGRRASRRP